MFPLKMFAQSLLNAESGIEPRYAAWYARNLNRAVLKYWAVLAPGELKRNYLTGMPELESITVSQYFDRLGIGWVARQINEHSLRIAQYAVVNAWGFIGYQFGEALLYEMGYYEPEEVVWRQETGQTINVKSYYSGDVPNEMWCGGVNTVMHDPYGRGQIILATHVNRWKGLFTGLDGVRAISDLKEPQFQTKIFRRALNYNYLQLRSLFEKSGTSLSEQIERFSCKGGYDYSLSGCLAASHLCGAEAVFTYLKSERDAQDETGTTLHAYMKRFSGYALDMSSEVYPAQGRR